MSIFETIFLTIGIMCAIFAAVASYAVARKAKFRTITCVAGSLIVAALCGTLWLPASLFMIALFMSEMKQI